MLAVFINSRSIMKVAKQINFNSLEVVAMQIFAEEKTGKEYLLWISDQRAAKMEGKTRAVF